MQVLGRYALGEEIARGGIASVHLGLVLGDAGFSRPVAIKRLLPALAGDPEVCAAFLDEARLASRVRHPNVVSTLDVRENEGELFLVLEYVHGASLAALIARARESAKGRLAPHVVSAILVGALRGLHAAHEATDDLGRPLEMVHRDVTPHNILVGVDGVSRVIDFGIAKAASRAQVTREGQVKGKLGYLAPEQLRQNAVRATDVYGAGVCLWEALVGRRAFDGDNESAVLAKVMAGLVDRPSKHVPSLPLLLDTVVLKALQRDPARRYATAEEMARALEEAVPPARAAEMTACVEELGAASLRDRSIRITALLAERESASPVSVANTLPVAPAITLAIARTAPIALPALPRAGASRAGRASLFVGATLTAIAVTMMLLSTRPVASTTNVPSIQSSLPLLPSALPSIPVLASTPPAPDTASPAADTPIDLDTIAVDRPPPAAAQARRGVGAHKTVAPASKPGCDPPYTLDGDGVRRYKKACLE